MERVDTRSLVAGRRFEARVWMIGCAMTPVDEVRIMQVGILPEPKPAPEGG